MPVIKSAKKRVLQSEKKRVRNVSRKSAIKTAVRKVIDAIQASDLDAARLHLKNAEAQISRAKGKGVIHRNTAARKISRLAKRVSIAASAQ